MGEHEVPAEKVHPGPTPDAADSPAASRPGPVAVARARVTVAGSAVPPPAGGEPPAPPSSPTTYRAGAPADAAPPLDRRLPGATVPPSTWSAFAVAERPATPEPAATPEAPAATSAPSPGGPAAGIPAPRVSGSARVPAPAPAAPTDSPDPEFTPAAAAATF
ncbi:hypothetical protein ACFXA2_17620 [Micromonospora chalcea]